MIRESPPECLSDPLLGRHQFGLCSQEIFKLLELSKLLFLSLLIYYYNNYIYIYKSLKSSIISIVFVNISLS